MKQPSLHPDPARAAVRAPVARSPFSPERKLWMASDLPEMLSSLPRPLVFTNCVFDILHAGHVQYLAQARALGASLLVGLNSDQSTRQLGKGPDRPLNGELERATVLGALEAVSAVMVFNEVTPLRLIEQCRPDIYVKGGDYDIDTLKEASLVRTWGGRAHALAFVQGQSTTGLVSRIRSASAA